MKSHASKVFAIDQDLAVSGKRLFINVALVGGALRHNLLPFLEEDVEQALRDLVEPKHFQPNLASLGFGYESVMEL
jgi:Pyruvate/2-oxoacid:ferredoxin oxidoreductase gamma subunit